MFKKLFQALFGGTKASASVDGQWSEGGLFVTPMEGGKFRPLKILKTDAHGVHIRVYSNLYQGVPEQIDESALYMAGADRGEKEPLGMGHLPVSRKSFSSWGAIFVQHSSVSPDELDGYQVWLEAKGGYF